MEKASRSKDRERSPSVERLRKKIKRLQETIKLQNISATEKTMVEHTSRPSPCESTELLSEISPDPSYGESSDKENEEDNENLKSEQTNLAQPNEEEEDFVKLEDEILEILEDDDSSKVDEFKFHPQLVKQWKKVLSDGLKKEAKEELFNRYPRKGNCPILTPILNPEIEATISETVKRRDKYLALDQDLCGASLSSVGEAVNMILNSGEEGIAKTDLLKILISGFYIGRIVAS